MNAARARVGNPAARAFDGFWRCRGRNLDLRERPLVMGVVNVTPDSFSDGGECLECSKAIEHGLLLVEQGADIIDVGGESTRPGAAPVDAQEEIRRIVPVVRGLAAASPVTLSIDTRKAIVARRALEAGAHIVNDVSALQADVAMADVVRAAGAGLVLMHMRGQPATMQDDPRYADVVGEVASFLDQRLEEAVAKGLHPAQIALDPGIGFGKTLNHNLDLLSHLDRLRSIGRPVLIGVSRKSFLGALTAGRPPRERLAAGLAAAALAVWQGAAVVRTHDVASARDALAVAWVLRRRRGDS